VCACGCFRARSRIDPRSSKGVIKQAWPAPPPVVLLWTDHLLAVGRLHVPLPVRHQLARRHSPFLSTALPSLSLDAHMHSLRLVHTARRRRRVVFSACVAHGTARQVRSGHMSEEELAKAMQEAAVLRRLRHANVVACVE